MLAESTPTHLHTQIRHSDNSVVISLSFTNASSFEFVPFVLLLPAEEIMTENRWKITCRVSLLEEKGWPAERRVLYTCCEDLRFSSGIIATFYTFCHDSYP